MLLPNLYIENANVVSRAIIATKFAMNLISRGTSKWSVFGVVGVIRKQPYRFIYIIYLLFIFFTFLFRNAHDVKECAIVGVNVNGSIGNSTRASA